MEKKFIQRDCTRYVNNEFSNMPSIDYGTLKSEWLNARTKSRIDWTKVKEICDKYGFGCTYINSTFGGDDAEFVVYLKTNINVDEYHEMLKNMRTMDDEYSKKYVELRKRYTTTLLEIHKCVHELDEQTYLMFDCGWAGNCGFLGNDDVRANSYSGGRGFLSWNTIIDRWSPRINDTTRKLSKGIYILMSTHFVKPELEDSPELDDTMEQNLLDIVKGLLSDKYVANYETGKRQYDKEPYKALIIRYKDGNDYCCMMCFSRDWMGRYSLYSARPLCGESEWVMDWQNPANDIRRALGSCAK